MANLTENTTYQNKSKGLSIADLSGLVKTLEERAKTESSNNIQSGITRSFSPSNIFTPSEPVSNLGSNEYKTFPVGQIIGEQKEGKYEDIPDYAQFVQPDERDLWKTPSENAQIRNWPEYLGGGQYNIDKTQPGALIKSERAIFNEKLNPGLYKSILGGKSSYLYEVDHAVPIWAGGSDTLANLQVFTKPKHEQKTAIQAVPLTLLVHKEIDLNQARLMASSWEDKDTQGLPSYKEIDTEIKDKDGKIIKYAGQLKLKDAEKMAERWEEDLTKIKPGKFFGESFKEEMGNFGEGWLPDPIREFLKGVVGGGTAGIAPGTGPSEDATGLDKVANIAGQIGGTITGLGLLSKGLGFAFKGAKSLLGIKKAANVAETAMKTTGLVTDAGRMSAATAKVRNIRLKKMAQSAGLLGLWGQIGLTGQKATGQVDAEFKDHVKRAMYDIAFGGMLGASGQSFKGYATVGIGTAALSLMENGEIAPALQDAALMVALHGMGYKRGMLSNKDLVKKYGNEEAYKMSAKTFNDYVGEVVPTAKRGQAIPEVLKLDLPKIDKMRVEYQKQYPTDQRFRDLGPITSEVEALNLMEQVARRKLGNLITKSDGALSVEQIKKEVTRIVVAKNQLYNQTLAPEARKIKEIKDLKSMGESLNPQLKGEQLRASTNKTSLLDSIPFEVPNTKIPNTNNTNFSQGEVPITGYGAKIALIDKNNINDFYKNPDKYSNKVAIVKDPDVATTMRYIQSEGVNVGNPDHALRIFLREKTPEGLINKPAGYMPREQSFNTKTNPLNSLYFEVKERISKKNPNLSEEQLEAKIAETGTKKYDSKLNNSTIAEQMERDGVNVLLADVGKVLPTGDAVPRYNPENPYLTIKLNEQDALKSIEYKNSNKVAPVQEAIKQGAPRQDVKQAVEGIKDFKKFEAEKKRLQPSLSLPETTLRTPLQGSTSPVKAPLTPNRSLPTTQVSTTPKTKVNPVVTPKEGVIEKAFRLGKITKKELKIFKEKEARYKELEQAMSERNLESAKYDQNDKLVKISEKQEMLGLSKDLNQFLRDKNIIKAPVKQKQGFVNYEKVKTRNKTNLLENALENARSNMELVKGKKAANDPESFSTALYDVSKGSRSIILDNKLNLSKGEQRELMKSFDEGLSSIIRNNVNNAFTGTKDLSGRKYSEDYGQFVGYGPIATSEGAVKFDYAPIKNLENKLDFFKKELNKDLTPTETTDIKKRIKDTTEKITANEKKLEEFKENTDQKLAKKYGLKLKEDGWLEKDKQKNPIFTDHFKKTNPSLTKTDNEMGKLWIKKMKEDLKRNEDLKTIYAEEYLEGLNLQSQNPGVYAKFAEGLKSGFKKIIVEPQEQWLQSAMKGDPAKSYNFANLMKPGSFYQQKMFRTINPQNHPISEPLERLRARVEGKSEAEIKKIEERVKEAEADASLERAERGISNKEESDYELGLKAESTTGEEVSLQDLKGMSITEDFQRAKIQDLTPFEQKFSSFIYELETGKIPSDKAVVNDVISTLKDFLSNYNAGIKKGGPIKKIFINENEAYVWEQNKKTGKNEKKQLFKGWSEIRKDLLKNNEVPKGQGGPYSGKGGPYDGQGGVFGDAWKGIKKGWQGLKGKFDGKVEYKAPKPEYNASSLSKAIGQHETSTLFDTKNVAYKPKNDAETYSYTQPHSGALGRYQVEPPTLSSYSKIVLGKKVTPKEFVANPALQDEFALKYIDRLLKQGMSPTDVAKAWNVGINGDKNGERAIKYWEDVSGYLD